MNELRKAAEMALEALETHVPYTYKDRDYEPIQALRQALAQPEQEPVENMKTYEIVCPHCDKPHDWTYLKGEWVGLTDEERDECINGTAWVGEEKEVRVKIVEAIEAKLKEKNTCCNHDCNEGRDCPERK